MSGHVLAQVESVEEAFLGLVLEEQDLAREAFAILIGVHEVALDADTLQLATGRHAQACRLFEHLGAGLFHQRGAVGGLIEGCAHQQRDDSQQAEPGEQGDFPLNREARQHGRVLRISDVLAMYRWRRQKLDRFHDRPEFLRKAAA